MKQGDKTVLCLQKNIHILLRQACSERGTFLKQQKPQKLNNHNISFLVKVSFLSI